MMYDRLFGTQPSDGSGGSAAPSSPPVPSPPPPTQPPATSASPTQFTTHFSTFYPKHKPQPQQPQPQPQQQHLSPLASESLQRCASLPAMSMGEGLGLCLAPSAPAQPPVVRASSFLGHSQSSTALYAPLTPPPAPPQAGSLGSLRPAAPYTPDLLPHTFARPQYAPLDFSAPAPAPAPVPPPAHKIPYSPACLRPYAPSPPASVTTAPPPPPPPLLVPSAGTSPLTGDDAALFARPGLFAAPAPHPQPPAVVLDDERAFGAAPRNASLPHMLSSSEQAHREELLRLAAPRAHSEQQLRHHKTAAPATPSALASSAMPVHSGGASVQSFSPSPKPGFFVPPTQPAHARPGTQRRAHGRHPAHGRGRGRGRAHSPSPSPHASPLHSPAPPVTTPSASTVARQRRALLEVTATLFPGVTPSHSLQPLASPFVVTHSPSFFAFHTAFFFVCSLIINTAVLSLTHTDTGPSTFPTVRRCLPSTTASDLFHLPAPATPRPARPSAPARRHRLYSYCARIFSLLSTTHTPFRTRVVLISKAPFRPSLSKIPFPNRSSLKRVNNTTNKQTNINTPIWMQHLHDRNTRCS